MATDKQSAEKEYTVEEKLSTLYQLQTMMTEIDKIKTLRGELPLEVQDLEDEIAGLETRLQNYQAEIKEFEASVVEQKHKITESTTLIDRYKAQLDNVRNNREFDNLTKEIGKDPVEVAEAPGFVVNKILIPMVNEAIDLVETGVASVADIDKAMMLGANHPMGPLALGDFIGLDVCLAIMETLYIETGDSKYRPALLLRKMVRGGLLGKKTGKGFYNY